MARPESVVAVVGNPRLHSRTGAIAACVVEAADGRRSRIVELAERPTLEALMGAGVDGALRPLIESVLAADVLVLASPTYKAAYTGLLKCFLDALPHGALEGKPVIPLMVGASEGHRLAVEFTLKPVIGELGGLVPPRGLYVLESSAAGDPPVVEAEARAALSDFTRAFLAKFL